MEWLVSLVWFWAVATAVGFIPQDGEDGDSIKRLAIVMAIAIPIVAFVMG